VACIRQYIRKRLEKIIDKLGQELFDSVVAQSKTSQTRRPYELSINASNERMALINHSRFSEELDDFIFSDQGKLRQTQLITFLTSRDFHFLQALLEADIDKQRQLIFSHQGFEVDRLGFFSHISFVLSFLPFEGDKLSNCNLGWCWASNEQPETSICLGTNSDIRA
jgi:hypothetical protein